MLQRFGLASDACRVIISENVADHAAQVVMDKAGVALDRCLFLPKGALPKTPSGKIQRFQCRRLLEQRALEPVAQVVLAGG